MCDIVCCAGVGERRRAELEAMNRAGNVCGEGKCALIIYCSIISMAERVAWESKGK